MQNEKKSYEAPKVTQHGTVAELTLKGGGLIADMPIGVGDTIGPGNSGTSA